MSLNIIVIVREVWDTRDLVGPMADASGQVRTGSLSTRFEPEDLNALEMALRIKDEQGGKVTAISIGKPGGVDVLRECLYRGADDAVGIDADPRALDAQSAAALLAAAIRKQPGFDLALTGVTVADGENAIVGSMTAALLGIEQASYVDTLVGVGGGKVTAKRAIEMGYEDVELPLPALLTVGVALLEDDPRTPRSAKAMLKLKAKKAEIPMLTPAALGVDLAGGRTEIVGHEAIPELRVESKEIDPENESALKSLLDEVLKGD
jgi:electron transfer flavoprotein beta subunit